MTRKVIALTIAAVLIISSVPPGLVAKAQDGPPPVITRISYKSARTMQGQASLKYEIYGTGFDNPIVYINDIGIEPASYSPSMITVQWAQGMTGEIFSPGVKTIKVQNYDGQASSSETFEVVPPPQVAGRDKEKAYVGESLEITGSGFDDGTIRNVYIAENEYSVGGVGS
ncbi:MAG: hypothetical protein PHP19_00735, partial [Firmicutes bacterium]|nr:hypothetical protein [Bacillota bacterium]